MTLKPRIMIVEDDAIIRKDLETRLPFHGYTVVGATAEAEAALDLAARLNPDLVLMDIHLAGEMDGITAARLIRDRLHLPVVFVTSFSEEDTFQKAAAADPYGYVLKPVKDRDLKIAIELALRLHRSDMALTQSESRYRELVERISDVIFTVNPGGLITYVSPVAETVLGYAPHELIGQEYAILFHPDDQPAFAAYFREALKSQLAPREFRVIHQSGEVRWIRLSSSPVNERGKPEGLRGLFSDITAQKRTETAIRTVEGKYKRMVETANEGVWVTDEWGTTTFANRQMADMLGCTVEDMIDRNGTEFMFPEDRQAGWPWKAAGESGTSLVERRLRRKDGSELWALASTNPLLHDDGRIIGSFAMFADITGRKKTEMALRESERKFSAAFHLGPVAVILTSLTDLKILDVNEAFRRETGYSRMEVINRTADELALFADPGDQARMMKELHLQGYLYNRELSVRTKSGGLIGGLFSCGTIFIGGNAVVLTSFLNISDHKRAEAELQEYREHLYHRDRVVKTGEIATSLAHELNQPLTGILNNAQTAQLIMARDKPDLAEIGAILADIVADDKRAAEVIGRLRAFLKKNAPDRGPADLNQTVLDLLTILRSDLVIKDVTIKTRLEPGLPNPRMDRIQIQQVLLNLVLNAEQAMKNEPKANRQIVISTSRHTDGSVLVTVQDSGTGIGRTEFERLFEPFFTSKTDGLGMGLPICRSIVEAHRGRIWAENNPVRGARILFTLPVESHE